MLLAPKSMSASFGPVLARSQLVNARVSKSTVKMTLLNEKCAEKFTQFNIKFDKARQTFISEGIVALLSSGNNVFVINLTNGEVWLEKLLPALKPIKFYSFYSEDRNVFSVWIPAENKLLFSHKRLSCGSVILKREPKVMKKYGNYYAFIDNENLITIYNKLTGDRLEISAPYHGMNQIDNLLFFNGMDRVVLLDYHSNIFTCAEIEVLNSRFSSWKVNKVYKAHLPSDESTVFVTFSENKLITFTESSFFFIHFWNGRVVL